MTAPAADTVPLLVARETRPVALGTALKERLLTDATATIEVMGPDRVSTAIKACAACRDFLAPMGFDLVLAPKFFMMPNRDRPGETLNVIRLTVTRIALVAAA